MLSLGGNRILISGASGLIGSALLPSLKSAGATVAQLARPGAKYRTSDEGQIAWDRTKVLSAEAVSGFDAVIHLAGESIVGRWTDEKKREISDSRVKGTSNLAQALASAKQKPRIFISASAIGYYGDRGDESLNEQSAAGTGFLSEVCVEWEAATRPATDAGIRTGLLRTGVVLSPRGGALAKMLTPFKLGVGGRIGSGHQWMSWIDIQDMVGAIHFLLQNARVSGPVNMVAPNPVTNTEFTKTLAAVLARPAIFPVPAFAVKLGFGEMGETALLGSQRVEPRALMNGGYSFHFSGLQASLEHLLGR
jgi:uncharacterized protein (TIGR01777 family)